MNRREIRDLQRRSREENRRWPAHLVQIPREDWAPGALAIADYAEAVRAVWRSRAFLVQVCDEPGGVVRISVSTTAIDDNGRARDGITWDQLQQIKAAVGFADQDAIEIYPAARDVVNVANMRHLWVLPEPVSCAWRAPAPASEVA